MPKRSRLKSAFCVSTLLLTVACSSGEEEVTIEEAPPEVEEPTSVFQPNPGDNVERVTGTGSEEQTGFSTSSFPSTRTSINTPNTTIGDAAGITPSALVGVAAATPVTVLTFDTRNGTLDTRSGNYDPATIKTTVGGNAFSVAADGARYTGRLIAGGDHLLSVLETPIADMPNSNRATYTGKGDVIYVNSPTSQTFTGTMDATVTARFGLGHVDIRLSNPDGQIDGVAYSSGGAIRIDDLAINGAQFEDDAQSSAAVTGFQGANDLNSGNQRLNALGLFGGPNAEETAAIARITDGSNGVAIIRLTAEQ